VALISFARGIPGPDLLPIDELSASATAALARDGETALNYGPPAGYPRLREWIAERHGVEAGRIVVTTGSLQGFNFVARHMVAAGAQILVEAPCYDRSLSILRRLSANVESIPLGADGLDLDALAGALERASGPALVYTIPTFQNPSGRTLSLANRRRLLDLVRERGATLLEDDPYGLLRFEGERVPTLFELSGGEDVLFLTSFSKTVAPGIRVGYLILPPDLAPVIEGYVLENYVSPSIFVQAALDEFVRAGCLEPNLERVRAGLLARRDAMLAALERELPEGAAWNRPDGGYFLWLDLPDGIAAETLLAESTGAEVTFIKGSDFFFGAGGEESARLAFSFELPDQIEEGIRRLGRLVREAAAVAA
jgi:DNA-binding transcriptional MocR family regulator